jgi:hypothetical protein
LSYHIQLICENYALNVSLMAIFRNTVSYMIYAPSPFKAIEILVSL